MRLDYVGPNWYDAPVQRYIVAAFFLVVSVRFAATADPGPIDPRFDGRWVGIETVTFHNAMESLAGPAPQIKTTLIIADSGKSLGVLSEFGSGRYLISPKSKE